MPYKKSAETRQKIIDAAHTLFVGKGYYHTTVKDIAKTAEIIHSAVYYYFKNKEAIAREIFDMYTEKIFQASRDALDENPDRLTNVIFIYILSFKYLALNRATRVVYYDLIHYADYDRDNLERVTRTFYGGTKAVFAEYGADFSDRQLKAFILTSDAYAKALFKGIINGHIDFTLEEAIDYFCRHILLSDIRVPEEAYRHMLDDAFRMSEHLKIEDM